MAIDERPLGRNAQAPQRTRHAQERGPKDVVPIDLLDRDADGRPTQGGRSNDVEFPLAPRGGELLRIPDARQMTAGRKDHGGDDNRAGEATPADLVDARELLRLIEPAQTVVESRAARAQRR
jgi:hypothetical protein